MDKRETRQGTPTSEELADEIRRTERFRRPATPEQWARVFKAAFFCEHTEESVADGFRGAVEDATAPLLTALRESAARYHKARAHEPGSSHDEHCVGDWDTCNSLPCRHAQFAIAAATSSPSPARR